MAAIGYIRVSTLDQNADLQRDALTAAGAMRTFEDLGISRSVASRPGLNAALEFLRAGDELIVWRLDRLGRNTVNVLSLLDELTERQVGFRSLTEGLDTSGSMGRVLITIMAAFAQLERDVNRERSQAGLRAARARGRVGGRPRSLNESKIAVARTLYAGGKPVRAIADELSCSVATVYRAISSPSTSPPARQQHNAPRLVPPSRTKPEARVMTEYAARSDPRPGSARAFAPVIFAAEWRRSVIALSRNPEL